MNYTKIIAFNERLLTFRSQVRVLLVASNAIIFLDKKRFFLLSGYILDLDLQNMNESDVYIHIVAIILILVFTIFYTMLIIISSNVYTLIKLISVVVLIAAIYIGANRNTYLPFLGATAVPPSIFQREMIPSGYNVSYVLSLPDVQDDTYVLYWGALSSRDALSSGDRKRCKETIRKNPIEAYGDYSNTGIVTAKNGKATLYFNCPDKYQVGDMMKKTVERHIHYRLIKPNSPIMSPVYTAYVKC